MQNLENGLQRPGFFCFKQRRRFLQHHDAEDQRKQRHGFDNTADGQVVGKTLVGFAEGIAAGSSRFTLENYRSHQTDPGPKPQRQVEYTVAAAAKTVSINGIPD